MSALVLDAGAFVAVDRDDRRMVARLRVVLLAEPGDRILTSDPTDLRSLAEAANNRALIVSC